MQGEPAQDLLVLVETSAPLRKGSTPISEPGDAPLASVAVHGVAVDAVTVEAPA